MILVSAQGLLVLTLGLWDFGLGLDNSTLTVTDITNERNVQGTGITSDKNVQILYTQNQFTVQVFTIPVYSTCIHRISTGM